MQTKSTHREISLWPVGKRKQSFCYTRDRTRDFSKKRDRRSDRTRSSFIMTTFSHRT